MAADEVTKKKTQNWDEVEILGPTFEPGKPEQKDDWRAKLANREQMLRYLKTGERYWYSDQWYGSEKRKTPA